MNTTKLNKLIKEEITKVIAEDLPTKEIDPKEFPNPLPGTKKGFLKKGDPKNDGGKPDDDVVSTKPVEIAVSKLKPSQDAIYLGKALAMAINGVEGGDLGAVISKDNYILDGHHRYAATSFNNPNASVGGVQAQLMIGDLVPVLRAAGDAMKNKRGVEPKGGDVNIFKATMDDVKAIIYKGKNVPPQFYDKDKAVAWFEKLGEQVIAKRLKLIQSKRPPSGAPKRKDMPKITPAQVNLIKNLLNKGKIDVRPPYANESITKKTFADIIKEEYDTFLTESFPDMKKWWKEDKDEVLGFVYWLQGKLPPSGDKKEKAWKDLLPQLQKKTPAPKREYEKLLGESINEAVRFQDELDKDEVDMLYKMEKRLDDPYYPKKVIKKGPGESVTYKVKVKGNTYTVISDPRKGDKWYMNESTTVTEAKVKIKAFGDTDVVDVEVQRDKTGHPHVTLIGEDGPYATITVILPETKELPKNEFFAKGWSENKEIVIQLIKAKVLIPTGKTAKAGHTEAHSFKLNPKYK